MDDTGMDDKEFVIALARTLYSGYGKHSTGAQGSWSDLDESDRNLWSAMARRAISLVDEMKVFNPTPSIS